MIASGLSILVTIRGDERKEIWPEKIVSAPGCAARESMDIVGKMVYFYEKILIWITNSLNRLI